MDYLNELKKFISILVRSQKFHLLCISSAPGWAKTHTTRQFLGELDVEYHMLGAYSTPLALYNHLSEFPNDISVIDDTAGLFYSAQALSILNAATWPGVSKSGKRVVTWASTSEKVSVPSFEFHGKIIVLTNFLPNTPQAKAFVNRSLQYNIRLSGEIISDLLLSAAKSGHFTNTYCAVQVAKFLGEKAREYKEPGEKCPISLRTLEIGVEIAEADPESWQELLENSIPTAVPVAASSTPGNSCLEVLSSLGDSGMNVEQQFSEFHKATGKSRRSFFYQRKKLGISRKESSH
ncbi:MAG: hypothetical protein NTV34_13320 [Proteobacteria bacterium]|nr:hypothetical protein [Pseudomonadota bacterium]